MFLSHTYVMFHMLDLQQLELVGHSAVVSVCAGPGVAPADQGQCGGTRSDGIHTEKGPC